MNEKKTRLELGTANLSEPYVGISSKGGRWSEIDTHLFGFYYYYRGVGVARIQIGVITLYKHNYTHSLGVLWINLELSSIFCFNIQMYPGEMRMLL